MLPLLFIILKGRKKFHNLKIKEIIIMGNVKSNGIQYEITIPLVGKKQNQKHLKAVLTFCP